MWNLRLPPTSAQSESALWQDLLVIYVHIKVWGAPTQCSVAAFLKIAITLSSQVKIHDVGMPIYFWANIHSKIPCPEDFYPPLLTLKLSREDAESITNNLNLLTMHFKKGKQGLDLHMCAWHTCTRTHTHIKTHTLAMKRMPEIKTKENNSSLLYYHNKAALFHLFSQSCVFKCNHNFCAVVNTVRTQFYIGPTYIVSISMMLHGNYDYKCML